MLDLSSSMIGRVVHQAPGRLRLRVERLHRTARVYDEIRGLLGTLPGVQAIEITPQTGSVLVTYDPTKLEVANLLRLGGELGWVPGGNGTVHEVNWRDYVDVPRAPRGATLLAVAALGGVAGRAVGLSARVGSISASAAYLLIGRWIRSVRQ